MPETFAQFLDRMEEDHPAYTINYYTTEISMISNRKWLRKSFTILDSGYQRCDNVQFYFVKVAKKCKVAKR